MSPFVMGSWFWEPGKFVPMNRDPVDDLRSMLCYSQTPKRWIFDFWISAGNHTVSSWLLLLVYSYSLTVVLNQVVTTCFGSQLNTATFILFASVNKSDWVSFAETKPDGVGCSDIFPGDLQKFGGILHLEGTHCTSDCWCLLVGKMLVI